VAAPCAVAGAGLPVNVSHWVQLLTVSAVPLSTHQKYQRGIDDVCGGRPHWLAPGGLVAEHPVLTALAPRRIVARAALLYIMYIIGSQRRGVASARRFMADQAGIRAVNQAVAA
jgi:hypothetical protein